MDLEKNINNNQNYLKNGTDDFSFTNSSFKIDCSEGNLNFYVKVVEILLLVYPW